MDFFANIHKNTSNMSHSFFERYENITGEDVKFFDTKLLVLSRDEFLTRVKKEECER